ncbi:conserved hypothetical protein, partial [Trichinella spiralis]|uniref:hypothetical protein n=1 Tax=Trichinella spiralis TaxID=6334 RepID=UPI0001EFD50D
LRQALCPAAFYFLLHSVLLAYSTIGNNGIHFCVLFSSLPSSPESRIHENFSRQISDDDV